MWFSSENKGDGTNAETSADSTNNFIITKAQSNAKADQHPPQQRKIVKAKVPPSPISTGTPDRAATASGAVNIDLTPSSDGHHNHHNHHDYVPPIKSSTAVTQELQEESRQQHRNERISKTIQNNKSKREEVWKGKRNTPRNDNANGASTPGYNPFSQFLEAFSVEPEFPHHKRSREDDGDGSKANGSAKRDINKTVTKPAPATPASNKPVSAVSNNGGTSPSPVGPPVGKRLKASTSSAADKKEISRDLGEESSSSSPWWTYVSIGVAAIAVVVGITAARRRNA